MTHYQKLATMLFRILGIALFSFGFIILGVSLIILVSIYGLINFTEVTTINFYWLFLIVSGILLFIMAKPLSKICCKGFNEN